MTRASLLFLAALPLLGHAPPIYLPVPPLRADGPTLRDATNAPFLLRGLNFPGLQDTSAPPPPMSPLSFRLIRQRWNANSVRIPFHIPSYSSDPAYRDLLHSAVSAARAESLIVILAAFHPNESLPTPLTISTWSLLAAHFRAEPGLVFDLFQHPSAPNSSTRQPADWEPWLNSFNALASAIRATGASHLLSAQAFHDHLGFTNLPRPLDDPNVIYQLHPTFDIAPNDELRQQIFGFLRPQFPLLAAEWGIPLHQPSPACLAAPSDPIDATTLLFQTLAWFDAKDISWSVADFRPASLIDDFSQFNPTSLDATLSCDPDPPSPSGIGQTILLWTTGDPLGFGSILQDLTASLAGGPPGPLAPGALIAFYGQGLGPDALSPAPISDGRLPILHADTQVLFDSIPAPILLANSFQVYVQVPYELAGRSSTTAQLFYRDVPSNRLTLPLAPAAPQLFTRVSSEVDATSAAGDPNTSANPASPGAIITLRATGLGPLNPPIPSGTLPGPAPSSPIAPLSLSIAGRDATILSALADPAQPGVIRITARLPESLPSPRAEIILRANSIPSRPNVTLWTRPN